eukprot:m.1138847 g.1138847  ORF g.1138847 m.1138847 type:complete len:53 (+) comp24441_c0_seq45:1193-1351(+)
MAAGTAGFEMQHVPSVLLCASSVQCSVTQMQAICECALVVSTIKTSCPVAKL